MNKDSISSSESGQPLIKCLEFSESGPKQIQLVPKGRRKKLCTKAERDQRKAESCFVSVDERSVAPLPPSEVDLNFLEKKRKVLRQRQELLNRSQLQSRFDVTRANDRLFENRKPRNPLLSDFLLNDTQATKVFPSLNDKSRNITLQNKSSGDITSKNIVSTNRRFSPKEDVSEKGKSDGDSVKTFLYQLFCCHNWYSVVLYILAFVFAVIFSFAMFKVYVILTVPTHKSRHLHRHYNHSKDRTGNVTEYHQHKNLEEAFNQIANRYFMNQSIRNMKKSGLSFVYFPTTTKPPFLNITLETTTTAQPTTTKPTTAQPTTTKPTTTKPTTAQPTTTKPSTTKQTTTKPTTTKQTTTQQTTTRPTTTTTSTTTTTTTSTSTTFPANWYAPYIVRTPTPLSAQYPVWNGKEWLWYRKSTLPVSTTPSLPRPYWNGYAWIYSTENSNKRQNIPYITTPTPLDEVYTTAYPLVPSENTISSSNVGRMSSNNRPDMSDLIEAHEDPRFLKHAYQKDPDPPRPDVDSDLNLYRNPNPEEVKPKLREEVYHHSHPTSVHDDFNPTPVHDDDDGDIDNLVSTKGGTISISLNFLNTTHGVSPTHDDFDDPDPVEETAFKRRHKTRHKTTTKSHHRRKKRRKHHKHHTHAPTTADKTTTPTPKTTSTTTTTTRAPTSSSTHMMTLHYPFLNIYPNKLQWDEQQQKFIGASDLNEPEFGGDEDQLKEDERLHRMLDDERFHGLNERDHQFEFNPGESSRRPEMLDDFDHKDGELWGGHKHIKSYTGDASDEEEDSPTENHHHHHHHRNHHNREDSTEDLYLDDYSGDDDLPTRRHHSSILELFRKHRKLLREKKRKKKKKAHHHHHDLIDDLQQFETTHKQNKEYDLEGSGESLDEDELSGEKPNKRLQFLERVRALKKEMHIVDHITTQKLPKKTHKSTLKQPSNVQSSTTPPTLSTTTTTTTTTTATTTLATSTTKEPTTTPNQLTKHRISRQIDQLKRHKSRRTHRKTARRRSKKSKKSKHNTGDRRVKIRHKPTINRSKLLQSITKRMKEISEKEKTKHPTERVEVYKVKSCVKMKSFKYGEVVKIIKGPKKQNGRIYYVLRACARKRGRHRKQIQCTDTNYKLSAGSLNIKQERSGGKKVFVMYACKNEEYAKREKIEPPEDDDEDSGSGSTSGDESGDWFDSSEISKKNPTRRQTDISDVVQMIKRMRSEMKQQTKKKTRPSKRMSQSKPKLTKSTVANKTAKKGKPGLTDVMKMIADMKKQMKKQSKKISEKELVKEVERMMQEKKKIAVKRPILPTFLMPDTNYPFFKETRHKIPQSTMYPSKVQQMYPRYEGEGSAMPENIANSGDFMISKADTDIDSYFGERAGDEVSRRPTVFNNDPTYFGNEVGFHQREKLPWSDKRYYEYNAMNEFSGDGGLIYQPNFNRITTKRIFDSQNMPSSSKRSFIGNENVRKFVHGYRDYEGKMHYDSPEEEYNEREANVRYESRGKEKQYKGDWNEDIMHEDKYGRGNHHGDDSYMRDGYYGSKDEEDYPRGRKGKEGDNHRRKNKKTSKSVGRAKGKKYDSEEYGNENEESVNNERHKDKQKRTNNEKNHNKHHDFDDEEDDDVEDKEFFRKKVRGHSDKDEEWDPENEDDRHSKHRKEKEDWKRVSKSHRNEKLKEKHQKRKTKYHYAEEESDETKENEHDEEESENEDNEERNTSDGRYKKKKGGKKRYHYNHDDDDDDDEDSKRSFKRKYYEDGENSGEDDGGSAYVSHTSRSKRHKRHRKKSAKNIVKKDGIPHPSGLKGMMGDEIGEIDLMNQRSKIEKNSIESIIAKMLPVVVKSVSSNISFKPTSLVSSKKKLLPTEVPRTTHRHTTTTLRPTTTKSHRSPTHRAKTSRRPTHTASKVKTTHRPTRTLSKPRHTTTIANLNMIIKGLKALGISQSVFSKDKQPTKTPFQHPTTQSRPHLVALHDSSKVRILCFGDSLTAGYNDHGKNFSPYCSPLQRTLNVRSSIPVYTETKGIVGEMTHKQMVGRLPLVLGNTTYEYDWVIILGGTNDILHVKNFADDQEFLNQLENVWQPRITKDIEKLHQIAYNNGAHTMLLTVPENSIEVWPDYKPLLKMRQRINDSLRKFAQQSKGKTVLCDTARKLPRHSLGPAQEAKLWDDHLHMTPEGYTKMANVVADCLRPYLPH